MRVPRSRRARALAAVAGVAVAIVVWLRAGPLPPRLLDDTAGSSTVVTDRHGETLYEVRSAAGLRGDWLDAHAIPDLLARATLAAEDIRFHWHPGIDPIAITRAAWRNVRAGDVEEGGSTITQQVAKLLLARQNGGASGWRAKAWEAVVALRLEHRLAKRDILALYLNLAPYGNQIQGASRAARAYFGRDVASLTPAETTFLAALPQQPGRFNPWRDARRAAGRQARLLATMRDRGWLAAADHDAALAERLTLTREDQAFLAPHFVERVIDDVRAARPRRVRTTLDATLQRTVQGIIHAQREALNRHHAANVAVLVLDNRSGEWLSWEGSGNYFDRERGGTIDGAVSPRQPGSALKPFTYAAAFERGFHPASVLADVPSQFPTADDGVAYSPRNYDGRYRGPMLARVALAGSENVPAVALASEIGVPTVARLLRRVGLSTLDQSAAHYGLGLTLGNAEVRLDELVAAYATFARGGEWQPPRRVLSVDGTPSPEAPLERVLSARTAFWITDVLSDPEARAFAFGRGGSLEFPFTVAAKTGTSQSYFDNWVVGYTQEVTVGVWVGNFDRTPLRGSSGITGAGPIFHAVMLAAMERARGAVPIGEHGPLLSETPDVERREICALSGMVAGAACPTRASEWLPRGRAGHSHETCTWHHASDGGLVTAWPAEYHEWAKENGIAVSPDGPRPTPFSEETSVAPPNRNDAAHLAIVRPLPGAVFMLDPTLRPEFQALTFVARGGHGPLHWTINGRPLRTDERGDPERWPLVRGRHEVVVRDGRGATAVTRIDVR
ncbi:MAG: penicillin-binding protein 1C [Acidobacteria bacterium]|nr:penicillin-binding protein 1C [Acidobacteriota bacterium]